MVYLLLDPRIYFPYIKEDSELISWFSEITNCIIKNQYSIKLILIEPMISFELCTNENMLKKEYMKELLMTLQTKKYSYTYFITDFESLCNDLDLDPDILSHIDSENIRNYFYKGFCIAYNQFHTNNLLSNIPEPNIVHKICYCENESYNFNCEKYVNIITEIEPFNAIFNKFSFKVRNEINYDNNTIQSVRKNMLDWYKSRHYKTMDKSYDQFDISPNFIEDIRENRSHIDDQRLIGSMMRTIISPSYKQSCLGKQHYIECHPNSTRINKDELIIEGEKFEIKRTYVLEDSEYTNGGRLDRIISTKYNEKIVFLNYVPEHDLTDDKIKKSIRKYLDNC